MGGIWKEWLALLSYTLDMKMTQQVLCNRSHARTEEGAGHGCGQCSISPLGGTQLSLSAALRL